jgi:hypothetical protein
LERRLPPNAARLFYDYILSKEGQEQLEVSREFRCARTWNPIHRGSSGFKYVIENPEGYKDFDATVKQYLEIFKLR